jgi:TolB-like protein
VGGHEDERMSGPPEHVLEALADRYRFENRWLGQGGMATVYPAHDLKHNCPVAVKILRPELADAIGVERFRVEITTMAALSHPFIVPLLDSGEAAGQLYYVMPHRATTLRDRISAEGQLGVADTVAITSDVATALSFAHAHGFVHRDVKPENILFADGRAQLADFGIAKSLAPGSADRLTKAGIRIGTPQYMSPEQCAGDDEIDARSDIYSLGCVVYEMLLGRVPFDGRTTQQVIARHLTEPVPPIRSVRPVVAEVVERAIFKALAKVPADRFRTATEFANTLLERESADTGALGDSIAVLPFKNVNPGLDTEWLADGIAEEIRGALGRVPGLRVAANVSSVALRGRSVAEIGAELHVAMVLTGSVLRSGKRLRISVELAKVSDEYQLWIERYDRKMTDVFAIQDEIAKAIVDRLQVTFDGAGAALVTPPTKNLDAYHLYLRGRHALEQRELELALESLGRAVALDGDYALAQAGFADACTLTAQYGFAPARALLDKIEGATRRALDLAPELAEAHSAAGTLALVFGWDWERAARELRRAVELNRRCVAAQFWLGLYLTHVAGNADEGLLHARVAVEVDPRSALAWAQLGMALIGAGQHEAAIEPLVWAAQLGRSLLIPNLYLGVNYIHLGKAPEALAALKTALRVSGRHPFTISALAVYHATLGNPADAQPLHDELVARSRQEYVQASMLSLTTAAIGRVDEAFLLLDKACDDRDGVMIFSKRYPAFALLQRDPRMERIYRRVGFPT